MKKYLRKYLINWLKKDLTENGIIFKKYDEKKISVTQTELFNIITEWTLYHDGKTSLDDFIDKYFED